MNKKLFLSFGIFSTIIALPIFALSCGSKTKWTKNNLSYLTNSNNYDSIADDIFNKNEEGWVNLPSSFDVPKIFSSTNFENLNKLNYLIPNVEPLSLIINPKYYLLDASNETFSRSTLKSSIDNYQNKANLPILNINNFVPCDDDSIAFLDSSFWNNFPELRYFYSPSNIVFNANNNILDNLPINIKHFSVFATFVKRLDLSKNKHLEYLHFDADKIESVTLPSSLKKLEGLNNGLFKKVLLPNGLKYIDGFDGGELNVIDIPNSVESIPRGSFTKNPLTSLRAPERFRSYFESKWFLDSIPTQSTLVKNMKFY